VVEQDRYPEYEETWESRVLSIKRKAAEYYETS
jgi:hypothetical protein